MSPLTVKQVAAELGVSKALVYSLIARGLIRHERHGIGRGAIRVTPEALNEYRKGRERGGNAAAPLASAPVKPPTKPVLRHVRLKP